MNISLVNDDRYFILPDAEQTSKTKSGIITSTSDDEKQYKTGVIKYAGTGRMTESGYMTTMRYAVGTRVMYEPRNQIKVAISDETLIVIRESNIIASFTEKE